MLPRECRGQAVGMEVLPLNSSIHYEMVAAVFLTLIFFIDSWKKHLPVRRVLVYQLLLCLMMLSSYMMFACDLMISTGVTGFLRSVVQALTFIVEIICFLCFHGYIMAMEFRLSWKYPMTAGSFLFICLMVLCLFLTPWTGLCFSYGVDGSLQRTWMFWGFAIGLFVILVYDLIVLWVCCRQCHFARKVLCSLMNIGFVMCWFVEVFQPEGIAFLNLGVVFFAYIFYLSQQSPDFYIDSVTGAYNRKGFAEVFRERMAYGQETSCFLVRVRNFGSMNQIYGEGMLREVQKGIYSTLKKYSSQGTVYHIGFSTCAVILASEEETRALYQIILEKLPTVWTVWDELVNHEYSFYQCTYPKDGQDFDELMQRLHYARSDHENHHKPGELIRLGHDTVEESEAKKKAAHLVEEAIMDNSIELNFQPIYSFEKDRITSLEVLSRLKDENKQYMNPEFFIHVAEENHTIIQLGEQIFRKACSFASRNHIFDYGIEDININLSPGQCRYEGLTERLQEIAAEYSLPMDKMHLEITESEFTDADAVGRTLQRLKDTGAKVALDDFGTGYSTLQNILELPVDVVKIDKSLVWSFAEGENQFLNDLMPMIKAEGKKIIAEGIETQQHIDIIEGLQGDYLQGYFFSKPLPEREFMRFLKDFNEIAE